MAIASATVVIDGQTYNLTYNPSNGQWEASFTAPGKTSFNLPGGFYNVQATARNTAGTDGTADADDLQGLEFVVHERIKPVITITSPAAGAYIANASQPIIGTITDEAGGSGVDTETVTVTVDGKPITNIQFTPVSNGYQFTATPDSVYANGAHTAVVNAADHDGNAADAKSVAFTVDTIPPVLNISSPAEGLITNQPTGNVIGTTNDATSSPVTVKINLNGTDQGDVAIGSDGGFSKPVTWAEGENTLTVTATDRAGKSTTITRTVVYDSSVPQITAATITPNPADAGQTVVISLTIVG